MPAMSNTSPVYNLAAIGQLHLLRDQFEQVLIPEAVRGELQPIRDRPEWKVIRQALEDGWLSTRSVHNRDTLRALTLELDLGEAEAIALALELGEAIVLIDESDGRAAAVQLGLQPTGVLGVLLKAKFEGQLASVETAMIELRDKARFFIHSQLFRQIIRLAGEEEAEA